jgi:hypothetical protein
MTTDTQAEIWTNGVEWAANEIARLRRDLVALDVSRQQDYELFRKELRYAQQRMEPIMFLIHRGNFNEIVQMMGPLDQERLRAMIEGTPT